MIVSLSTWKHGFNPNSVCYTALQEGHSALDSVEKGAIYCEEDLTCMSVGAGGIPDDAGVVTLDASIMDHQGNCGSVAFVQNYVNAASIARRVMEKTPHIMLAGSGAEKFAEDEGFLRSTLLTDKAKRLYEEWRKYPDKLHVRLRRGKEGEHEYVFELIDESGAQTIDRDTFNASSEDPIKVSNRAVNESHDTIGLLALDDHGRLAGACTTSGLAFKKHGRVGDSPIIGAGLYVDGEVAAAVATGTGELVMRSCSTFHIVEMIRQGIEPDKACELAAARILQDRHLTSDMLVGLMVIRKDGAWSCRSIRSGFQFAVASSEMGGKNMLYDCDNAGFSLAQ